ncbi:MAG TPA: anti-sigma regulatory factor [Anaeromyxobacteraceae bacterium]|nr:anti-sigma regulatory factor [Anaeromyxobacteraceae bacterium]
MSTNPEVQVAIRCDADIVRAREGGRELARQVGFGGGDLTLIATAISELARNIVLFAGHGEIVLRTVADGRRTGVAVVARDTGPGIPDVERALQVGFSTSGSLGLGLPGVRRLMDDFDLVSRVGAGTTVTATKWKP